MFGEQLKALRVQSGKSQSEVVAEMRALFGAEAHISQSTLSALERRSTAPRGAVLERLTQYYNVPVSHFYRDKLPPNQVSVADYLTALRLFTPSDPRRFDYTGITFEHDIHPLDMLGYDERDEFLDT
jgi:transcriptional regulator with XRE-family HTH domain